MIQEVLMVTDDRKLLENKIVVKYLTVNIMYRNASSECPGT